MNRKLIYPGIVAVILLGLGAAWVWWPAASEEPTATDQYSPVLDRLTLSPEQVRLANLLVEPVKRQTLQPTRTIPGRLDYDQDRHVEVKAACSGVITEMLVRPGDSVKAGQTVAIISSPEVGAARAEILQRQTALELARTQQQWKAATCTGVETLVKLIRDRADPETINRKLEGEELGDYRQRLVTAYEQLRLAEQMSANIRDAAVAGAVAGKLGQQRETARRSSEADVAAAAEQSLFEARQRCKQADADLKFAERQLTISCQKLRTLLGPASREVVDEAPVANELADADAEDAAERLSEVRLSAPIDGAVEERMLTASERVAAGQSLFIIADTSRLWAVADIRERDWETIAIQSGQEVRVESPALPDQIYPARVLFVGRTVDPLTGAAPLVAQLDATDRRLRPGLFIRMTAPVGEPVDGLFVREASVVVHEGQHFVFTPSGDNAFRRVDVQIGRTINGWTEILAGVSEGERIVDEGAFLLKSQLLLSGEEEE